MDVGTAIFHGYVESMDANGNYHGVGFNGQPLSGVLTARPYGFRSRAPKNTGLVLTYSQAGLLVLSQINALPSGVSEPESGETLLYNSQGAQVKLDKNGDILAVQKSGRYVLLGNNPTKLVALDGDDCDSNTTFDTWAANVELGIESAGGTPVVPSWTPGSALATIDSSATEVKAK